MFVKKKISKKENEISETNQSSWTEVECLGACVNAPMIQINENYFEDLDSEKLEKIIDKINKNEKPQPGSGYSLFIICFIIFSALTLSKSS